MKNTGCLDCQYYDITERTAHGIRIVSPPNMGCWATKTSKLNPLTGEKDYQAGPCDILNRNCECSLFRPKISEEEIKKRIPPVGLWQKIKNCFCN